MSKINEEIKKRTKKTAQSMPKGFSANEYDEIFIYVPEEERIFRIAEGTGDNLLPEDEDEGYVDYTYYDSWKVKESKKKDEIVGKLMRGILPVSEYSKLLSEDDGGQCMLCTMFRDIYTCTKDSIPTVLDMALIDEDAYYIPLIPYDDIPEDEIISEDESSVSDRSVITVGDLFANGGFDTCLNIKIFDVSNGKTWGECDKPCYSGYTGDNNIPEKLLSYKVAYLTTSHDWLIVEARCK